MLQHSWRKPDCWILTGKLIDGRKTGTGKADRDGCRHRTRHRPDRRDSGWHIKHAWLVRHVRKTPRFSGQSGPQDVFCTAEGFLLYGAPSKPRLVPLEVVSGTEYSRAKRCWRRWSFSAFASVAVSTKHLTVIRRGASTISPRCNMVCLHLADVHHFTSA